MWNDIWNRSQKSYIVLISPLPYISDYLLLLPSWAPSSWKTVPLWLDRLRRSSGGTTEERCFKPSPTTSWFIVRFNWEVTSLSSRQDNGRLGVWRLSTGECLQTLGCQEDQRIGVMAKLSDDVLVTVGQNQKMRVWSVASSKCIETYDIGLGNVTAMIRLKNGSLVIALNGCLQVLHRRRWVCIIDTLMTSLMSQFHMYMYRTTLTAMCCESIGKNREMYNVEDLRRVLPTELFELCFDWTDGLVIDKTWSHRLKLDFDTTSTTLTTLSSDSSTMLIEGKGMQWKRTHTERTEWEYVMMFISLVSVSTPVSFDFLELFQHSTTVDNNKRDIFHRRHLVALPWVASPMFLSRLSTIPVFEHRCGPGC